MVFFLSTSEVLIRERSTRTAVCVLGFFSFYFPPKSSKGEIGSVSIYWQISVPKAFLFACSFLELGEIRFHVMHLGLDYWIEFCKVHWG